MSNLSEEHRRYLHQVMGQLMGDLSYPQDKEGNTLDTNLMKTTVAYHLVRAGWRKPNNTDGLPLIEAFDDPQIKRRKIYGPGVYEDACTWVPFSAPDDPLDGLEHMTMAQIHALPADLRGEALRRLGMAPQADCSMGQPPWQHSPLVTITAGELKEDA